MKYMKWTGVAAALVLVISCFLTWVTIDYKNLVLTGVDTTGTSFGKPAYFHFLLTAVFLALTFIKRVWSKRLNLLITALNLAWAVRNFFIIAQCSGGECPHREAGMWLMLISSLLMLLSALFPDMPVPGEKKN
jgi:hypothetical protein